jgi:excisionase family DNA binding protein
MAHDAKDLDQMSKVAKVAPPDFESAGPYITVDEWCAIRRSSRPTAYRLLAAGRLRAVKSGHRTLILTESARHEAASLPDATFRATA